RQGGHTKRRVAGQRRARAYVCGLDATLGEHAERGRARADVPTSRGDAPPSLHESCAPIPAPAGTPALALAPACPCTGAAHPAQPILIPNRAPSMPRRPSSAVRDRSSRGPVAEQATRGACGGRARVDRRLALWLIALAHCIPSRPAPADTTSRDAEEQ